MNRTLLRNMCALLAFLFPIFGYSSSHPFKLLVIKNDYEKHSDPISLLKAVDLLSYFGMMIDSEHDDIEMTIADWMAVPENHTLFFEELNRQINESAKNSLKCSLLPILERLSSEWGYASQK